MTTKYLLLSLYSITCLWMMSCADQPKPQTDETNQIITERASALKAQFRNEVAVEFVDSCELPKRHSLKFDEAATMIADFLVTKKGDGHRANFGIGAYLPGDISQFLIHKDEENPPLLGKFFYPCHKDSFVIAVGETDELCLTNNYDVFRPNNTKTYLRGNKRLDIPSQDHYTVNYVKQYLSTFQVQKNILKEAPKPIPFNQVIDYNENYRRGYFNDERFTDYASGFVQSEYLDSLYNQYDLDLEKDIVGTAVFLGLDGTLLKERVRMILFAVDEDGFLIRSAGATILEKSWPPK